MRIVLLICCWLTTVSWTNGQAPAHFEPAFEWSAYPIYSTLSIRVSINNHWQQPLQVRIVNNKDEVVYQEVVQRKQTRYRRIFNLEDLPSGEYRLVVNDEKQRHLIRSVVIAPRAVEPVQPTRQIVFSQRGQ